MWHGLRACVWEPLCGSQENWPFNMRENMARSENRRAPWRDWVSHGHMKLDFVVQRCVLCQVYCAIRTCFPWIYRLRPVLVSVTAEHLWAHRTMFCIVMWKCRGRDWVGSGHFPSSQLEGMMGIISKAVLWRQIINITTNYVWNQSSWVKFNKHGDGANL